MAAANRRTPGMDKWRKKFFLFKFLHRGGLTNYERAMRDAGKFTIRVIGLISRNKRSWKGPLGFQPRCNGDRGRCMREVKKDMQRCPEHTFIAVHSEGA